MEIIINNYLHHSAPNHALILISLLTSLKKKHKIRTEKYFDRATLTFNFDKKMT